MLARSATNAPPHKSARPISRQGSLATSAISAAQWARLCEDGARIGRALAAKVVAAGADEILGFAPPRAATYGAAEQPLDRAEA